MLGDTKVCSVAMEVEEYKVGRLVGCDTEGVQWVFLISGIFPTLVAGILLENVLGHVVSSWLQGWKEG